MKQNKLKNYLKLGILLCGVFIFLTNCQHDDLTNNDFSNHNQNKNPISLKFSNYEELEQDYKFTNALKNIKPQKGFSSIHNKTVMEEQYGFNIDSTLIKQVDIGDFTSYTMFIHREAPNPDFFENLVVQVDSLNNINAYIVKYLGTNTYYEAHESYGINADIEITPITYNASESTSSKMVYICNEIYEVRCNGGIGGCNGRYHTPNENCYQNWSACIGLTQTGQSCGYYDDGTGGGGSSSTGDDSSGGGGESGGSSSGGGGGSGGSSSGDNGIGDACKSCGDNGEVVTAPVIDEEIEDDDCLPNINCRQGEIMDEDCECRIDLEDPCANKDLRNYEVATEVVNMLESRQQPNTMVQSSELVDSFILETIDDGWGDINQDRFSIKIDELPYGYTPFQLFNEIRMNFTNLVVGGNIPYATDVNLEPYSDLDGITWVSDNPVGAAMDFDTRFDTSTVYCVEYNEDEMYWIFATVTSYDHQGHFVAGLRQFGLEPNGSGGYSFYVRAADRLGGVADVIGNVIATIFSDESLFTLAGDTTWKNLMENTTALIQNQGGIVEEFDETKTYGARHPYDEDDCQD